MNSEQPAQQPAATTGRRDTMFCHECQDEWYRDEHGLTCPECGSEFTEIIEDDNDPRDQHILAHGHGEGDDTDSMPGLEGPLPHHHPLHNHNPWANNDDPEEQDISNLQFRQLGPGRFAVTGTMYRTLSASDLFYGAGAGGGGPSGAMGGFASMLSNVLGGGLAQTQNPNLGSNPSQGQGESQAPEGQAQDNEGRRGNNTGSSGSGTLPGGHRFTYTNARLFPRDSDHPGPRVEPVDQLNNVLVGLMAAFGEPPNPHPHHHHHGLFPNMPNADGNIADPAFNPLMSLITQMIGGSGQIGDAVYSQEALDRIISQLMEQNAGSNAPGPASQSDIDALPRKTVTVEMLGAEGRAECSICMDEVNVGEEVTELPCHHWFHHQCVSAWLNEHDTCPHCRKGITKRSENNGQPQSSTEPGGQQQATGPGSTSAAPEARPMPGSFEAVGEGTDTNPHMVSASSPPSATLGQSTNQDPSGQAGAPENDASGSGLGDRLRRGWFGSQ